MSIVRYTGRDPFKEITKFFDWKPATFFDRRPAKLFNMEWPEMRFPALDIEEKEDTLLVKAEIPGVKPEEMNVELNGDQLMIRGEKKEEKEEKDEEKKYYYKERSFGSFSRTVNLGVEVDPEDINAEYKDGILTVTLKKQAAKKAKKIDIKSG